MTRGLDVVDGVADDAARGPCRAGAGPPGPARDPAWTRRRRPPWSPCRRARRRRGGRRRAGRAWGCWSWRGPRRDRGHARRRAGSFAPANSTVSSMIRSYSFSHRSRTSSPCSYSTSSPATAATSLSPPIPIARWIRQTGTVTSAAARRRGPRRWRGGSSSRAACRPRRRRRRRGPGQCMGRSVPPRRVAHAGHVRVPAPVSTNTRVMQATPEQVWEVLADGWLYPLWVVGASRMREVDDEWPAPGARLHHSVGTWPLLLDDETEVVESVPGTRLVLHAHAWPSGRATVTLRLNPLGAETEVVDRGAGDGRSGCARPPPRPGPDARLAQRRDAAPARLPRRAPAAGRRHDRHGLRRAPGSSTTSASWSRGPGRLRSRAGPPTSSRRRRPARCSSCAAAPVTSACSRSRVLSEATGRGGRRPGGLRVHRFAMPRGRHPRRGARGTDGRCPRARRAVRGDHRGPAVGAERRGGVVPGRPGACDRRRS